MNNIGSNSFTNIKPYFFHCIDLSNKKCFDINQSICFSNGLTIISSRGGMGKTTIANILYKKFIKDNKYLEDFEWLIFFSEAMHYPVVGIPYKPLSQALTHLKDAGEFSKFDEYLTRSIRELLKDRIYSEQLYATVSFDGQVSITAVLDDGDIDMNDVFESIGGRLVLCLSIIFAIRKMLSIDVPFIIDGAFGVLDSSLLQACVRFIGNISGQSIIFGNDVLADSMNYLSLPKDLKITKFNIIRNSANGKSIIERI